LQPIVDGPFTRMTISKDYKRPVVTNAVAQGIVLLLGCMVLDGGFFLAASIIAVAAYWAGFVIVVARRPASPTKGDLIWASAGFAIAFALTFALGPLVLYLRGRL
jgi:hypothetical protein